MSNGFQGVRTSDVTIAEACVELIAGANDVRVKEISIYQAAASAQSLGLGKPAAAGITPTSPVAMLDDDGAAMTTKTALAWGTAPTAPAEFFKRWNSPATAGAGVVWSFPGRGLLVKAGQSLTVHNITAGAVCDVNFAIEEISPIP